MGSEKIDKLRDKLMTVYVLFYLCIFPMAMHNKYFDIALFRYRLFWIPTFVYGCIFLVLLLIEWKLFPDRRRKPTFSKQDIFFTVLILEMGISTLLAPYQYEAFWGNRGRRMGFFIWAFFYIAYILITRFYHYKEWHLKVIMIAMIFPCILGIINFFLLDPFHFFDGVDEKYIYTFASTFGNINTYSAYAGMSTAICTSCFVLYDKNKICIPSFFMMILTMTAFILSVSDNTVLSALAIFGILPIIAFTDLRKMIRYLISLGGFAICMKCASMIYLSGRWTMNRYGDSMLIDLGGSKAIYIFLVILFLTTIFLTILKKKGMKLRQNISKTIRIIWGILIIATIVIGIFIFIYINTHMEPLNAEKLPQILIFNDAWGTGRGLNWRLCMDYFLHDTSFVRKLFGNGPDTYFIIMMDRYRMVIEQSGYGYLDSAHNEYLEYLVTIGIAGLILYIIFIFKTIMMGFLSKEKAIKALSLAIFTYASQAIVNIAVPILVPMYIVYIAIVDGCRKA